MSTRKDAVVFKTDVLGVGPWCVEFPDGEIVTARTEERAKRIALAEASQRSETGTREAEAAAIVEQVYQDLGDVSCAVSNATYARIERWRAGSDTPAPREMRDQIREWLSRPHSDCYFSFEQYCPEDREGMVEELAAFMAADQTPRASSEGEQGGDIPGPDWQDALTNDTTIGFNFWERIKILFGCRVNVHMKTLCEISPGATQHWPEWSRVCVLKHRWWPHKTKWQFVGESPDPAQTTPPPSEGRQ